MTRIRAASWNEHLENWTKCVRQQFSGTEYRTVIRERRETNKVRFVMTMALCLEAISESQSRDGKGAEHSGLLELKRLRREFGEAVVAGIRVADYQKVGIY